MPKEQTALSVKKKMFMFEQSFLFVAVLTCMELAIGDPIKIT